MLSVTLFRRGPESAVQKSGVGSYGDKIERALVDRGKECKSIFLPFTKHAGLFRAIKENFILPLMRLIDLNGSCDVYHATEEFGGIFLPLARGKKAVTFHHVMKPGEDMSGTLKLFLWNMTAKISIRYADVIFAVSSQTRNELIDIYKADPKKIEVLPLEIGKQFRALDDVKRTKTVGYVSSLIPRKNTAALIRSFAKVTGMPGMSDAKLVICGKGPELENLTHLAKELSIEENVEFVNGLTDEEVVRLYNSSSVTVLPSHHEGFGLSIIEAQRCFAPVLYFKNANIPEEVTRYAVPCTGEDDMAEQMFRCLSDDGYRDGIASAALEYASDFGEDFGERTVGIYERLVQQDRHDVR